ncbi:hypothetical protein BH20VER3_BH20VER3_15220 [soil metagenome]
MPDEESKEQLEVYLQDHYAGGIGALELIEHSIKAHAGTPLAGFLEDLRADVKADHQQLENLMSALGFEPSGMRNTGAWMVEKFGRAKIGFSGGESSELRLFQTLEGLYLGITGKLLRRRALEATKNAAPALQKTDFAQLAARASDQLERVETERITAAGASPRGD